MTGVLTGPQSDVEGGRVADSCREGPSALQLGCRSVHRDQKIGLALAVLVLGFAGAFCFRNRPPIDPQPLSLGDTADLDARIEQLPVRAYTAREGVTAELDPQTGSDRPRVSANRGLADQVIRFGIPGSQQVLDDGGLVDLFPGPPEPLIVEGPSEPLIMVGSIVESPPPAAAEIEPESPESSVEPPEKLITPQQVLEDAPPTPRAVEMPPVASDEYVVKSGDTLSGIAEKIYGTSRRYLDLYRANRDVLSDPDDLPVGTTLLIP